MNIFGSSIRYMAKLTFQPRYYRFQQKPKTDLYRSCLFTQKFLVSTRARMQLS